MAGQVEMVCRFVQHQQVHPTGLQQRQRRPGPLPRGERDRRPENVFGFQPELREQGAHLRFGPVRDQVAEGAQQRWPVRAAVHGPGRPHPPRPRTRAGLRRRRFQPAEQQREQSRLPAAVRAGHSDPIADVDLQVHRAEGEVAAPGDRALATATTLPDRGAAGIEYCNSHSLRGSATSGRRSISPLGLSRLRRLLLGLLDPEVAADLVVVLAAWSLPCGPRHPSRPAAFGRAPPVPTCGRRTPRRPRGRAVEPTSRSAR